MKKKKQIELVKNEQVFIAPLSATYHTTYDWIVDFSAT